MKTKNVTRQAILFVLLTITMLIAHPVFAYDNATIETAAKYYQSGFTDYNMKQWSYAARSFSKSFQVIPHSMTAYMLSATSLHQKLPRNALEYAKIAMKSEPKLAEPYVTAVREIAEWAAKSKDDPYYVLSGKADDGQSRPVQPKFFPPQPDIPNTPDQGPASLLQGNAFIPIVPVTPLPITDFTGRWRCNDGGMYFIRQTGTELWWYGQSQDGKRWTNVFHGSIQGKTIQGKWADVPKGQTKSSGKITLTIIGNNKLRAISKSGGFGGSEWVR